MKIDPEDVQRVTDIIDALREKVEKEAELRMAIEKGDSIAVIGTQVALARIGGRLLGLSGGSRKATHDAACPPPMHRQRCMPPAACSAG